MRNAMIDRTDDVVDRDPAPVLVSAPYDPADPHFERRQHLCEGPSFLTENDTGSQIDNANPFRSGGFARCFPFATDICQKTRSPRRCFIQQFTTAITIKPNRRSTDQCFRRGLQLRDCFTQQPGSFDTTATEFVFYGWIPAFSGDVLACQVNDNFRPFDSSLWQQVASRVPDDVVCLVSLPSSQSINIVPLFLQKSNQF